jgi:aromatic-L-amino-acid/L-tryptophan decarboxylase
LSELLYEYAKGHPEIEAFTHNLSIATFRYRPADHDYSEERLNELNEKLLNTLQEGGELFLSNAVLNGKYCLRTCIVNFRTSEDDIKETIDIIVKEGRKIHSVWRQESIAEKIAEAGS